LGQGQLNLVKRHFGGNDANAVIILREDATELERTKIISVQSLS
jgi:hypothetical protein